MREPPARLVAFSGVYSNHRALRATLDDLAGRGADLAWCLGDLGGFGPHPDRSIELLREAGLPCIAGNYDEAIGAGGADCGCGYSDPRDRRYAQIAYDYTLERTAPEHRAWMRALPARARLEVGDRRVLLCHGSPRRVNEFLWESTCSDAFLEWLCEAHDADVLVCGHTGIPWWRTLPSGRTVVNVGAIGRPANDGRAAAWSATIEIGETIDVELRAVAYEHEALAREMEAERLPPEFVETIRSGWWTTCLENLPVRERTRGRH